MNFIPQIIFLVILCVAAYFIFKSVRRIIRNINLGRSISRSDKPTERLKLMLLVALGQKKMFKKPIPALLHLAVYVGFIIVNIEVLEIVIDGLAATHRVLLPFLGSVYTYLINVFEFFAVAVIISCIVFLWRRNVIHVARFAGEEMKKWPKLDANLILSVEILLMLAFLTMNATDLVLQGREGGHYAATGSFMFSSWLVPFFQSSSSFALTFIERACWWFHIIGILAFANYIFWDSKHMHIFMAFPNVYFSKLAPKGEWNNMPSVTHEVKLMLNLPVPENPPTNEAIKFGASDVTDLSWKNLMDAYSCTECGRCTQQCPANITGQKLSPRKIMMDTRDRMEEVGKGKALNGNDYNDEKSLLDTYITAEEILACTTCNACVEACPVNIDPLNIITQLRQYKIMEASQAPGAWNNMFANIENNSAPWKFSPADRYNWASKLEQNTPDNE